MAVKKYTTKELRHRVSNFCDEGICPELCERGRCPIDVFLDHVEKEDDEK